MNTVSSIPISETTSFIPLNPLMFWGASFMIVFFIILSSLFLFFYLKAQRKVHFLQNMQFSQTSQTDSLQNSLLILQSSQDDLKGRLNQMLAVQNQTQTDLTKNLENRLEKMSYRMHETLSKSSEKTGENLSKLHERLALIDRTREQMVNLTGQVSDLREIFSSHKKRGAFGEMHMQDLIRTYLPPQAYCFQKKLPNDRRVDAIIYLPDTKEGIAIDAKFPLESFQHLSEADTEEEQKAYSKTFRDAIFKHIRDIAERYLIPGITLEPALLFLPSEAIYFELYTHHYELVEKSFQKRVMIVSPTTFMAALATMRAILKNASLRDHAVLIQKEVSALLEDITRLDKRTDNLQKHFALAEKDLRELKISTDKISRRSDGIKNIDFDSTSLEKKVGLNKPSSHSK